jgi:hypothetical protein
LGALACASSSKHVEVSHGSAEAAPQFVAKAAVPVLTSTQDNGLDVGSLEFANGQKTIEVHW